MIGDIVFLSNHVYVIVNKNGTMERLPCLNWFWRLVLYFKTYRNKMTLQDIRTFSEKHSKPVLRGFN